MTKNQQDDRAAAIQEANDLLGIPTAPGFTQEIKDSLVFPAKACRIFYEALISEDLFDKQQAFELTRTFLLTVLKQGGAG